jgi:acyl carrier protein
MWQQFHIGGLVDLLLAPLSAGGALILTAGFDAADFFALRARFAPTWTQGVPTTLGEALAHAARAELPPGPGSLRLIRCVAAALTPALQARLEDFFEVPVVRTLGMTEAGPLITSTALPPARDKPGSVGRPCGPELSILGPDGAALPRGETGDIAVRGENVFSGYEANPEANAAAFRDGWFLTGDRGHLDADGDLFLTGRVSEQINRGGYKIMPAEVEQALAQHPQVHEAAVFGLAHPTLGEDIAAAVTLTPGAAVDADGLRAHLAGLVAANKVPARLAIRAHLPRNPVGKVDRLALALETAAAADDAAVLLAPRSPAERAIAEIWARELELPEIGIRQDFMMMGGDSLSALRVILAMEKTFGAPMPDSVVETLTTVEAVAELLEAAGVALPQAGDAAAPQPPRSDRTAGGKIAEIGDAAATEALEAVASQTELDLAFRQLVVYRTPDEIAALLPALSLRAVGRTGAPMLQRLHLSGHFARKRKDTLAEIAAGGPAARRWTRRELAPSATLYSAPDRPVWEKTLIAGFSGNGQGMSTEMYRFLLPLDPDRFDFVLLQDVARIDLYLGGLPEMGDSITELGAWLDDFADTEGYARRMALGTSGGGLAAVHTGLGYNWDDVVAVCPPPLSKHQGYAADIAALGAAHAAGGPGVLIANGHAARDLDAVRQLLAHLPGAENAVYPECTKHNLLNFARETGQLAPLYARLFDRDQA